MARTKEGAGKRGENRPNLHKRPHRRRAEADGAHAHVKYFMVWVESAEWVP